MAVLFMGLKPMPRGCFCDGAKLRDPCRQRNIHHRKGSHDARSGCERTGLKSSAQLEGNEGAGPAEVVVTGVAGSFHFSTVHRLSVA